MGSLYLCKNLYAKRAYWISHLEKGIYSIEELCFYLYKYTHLIDKDVLNSNLATWIMDQCNCMELGKELQILVQGDYTLLQYVNTVLKHTSFLTSDEEKSILEIIETTQQFSLLERKKVRADEYVKIGQYYVAIDQYIFLLEEMPQEDIDLRKKIYHNCGIAYARLFYYSLAAQQFWNAYKLMREKQDLQSYLFCKKEELSDEDYASLIAENPQYNQMDYELERELNRLEIEWSQSEEYNHVRELEELLVNEEKEQFMQKFHCAIKKCKTQYVEMTKFNNEKS